MEAWKAQMNRQISKAPRPSTDRELPSTTRRQRLRTVYSQQNYLYFIKHEYGSNPLNIAFV